MRQIGSADVGASKQFYAGKGSRVVVGGDAGAFVDPDGYEWVAAG